MIKLHNRTKITLLKESHTSLVQIALEIKSIILYSFYNNDFIDKDMLIIKTNINIYFSTAYYQHILSNYYMHYYNFKINKIVLL